MLDKRKLRWRVNEVAIPEEYRELSELLSSEYSAPDPNDPVVAARRRRRRRNRVIGGSVALALLAAAVGTYTPLVLLAPIDATTPVATSPLTIEQPAAVAYSTPAAFASAFSVTGAEEFPQTLGVNGITTLAGDNAPLPIASISKVVTALVILDAKPLGAGEAGPTITFTKADDDLYDKYYLAGATIQSMKAGATMTERDALGLMMLASASNYAEATATWAFGSPGAFRSAATRWLAANGLGGTTIVEPTGIDPRNASTPSDLIAIGRLAMAHPALSEIVQTKSIDVPPLGTLVNSNPVLGTSGVNGIKTGTLIDFGANLLYSASLEVGLDAPITVIGVVLGGQDQHVVGQLVRAQLATLASGFHTVSVVEEGDSFGSYTTPWDDTAEAVAASGAELFTWSDLPVTSVVTIDPVSTGAAGDEVGSVTYTAGARTVMVPLVLDDALNGPGGWWRLGHPGYLLGD